MLPLVPFLYGFNHETLSFGNMSKTYTHSNAKLHKQTHILLELMRSTSAKQSGSGEVTRTRIERDESRFYIHFILSFASPRVNKHIFYIYRL